MLEDVTTGKRPLDMLNENPAIAGHDRALKFMRFTVQEAQSDRQALKKLRVIFSYGETDLGKTYSAVNFIAKDGDYHIQKAPTKKGDKLWFDGYIGQKYLILDDWDGSSCSISELKRILDVYKYSPEIKGNMTWALWHTVIITSNIAPRDWFIGFNGTVDQNAVAPVRRRVSEIRHYLERSIYQLEDWDGNILGDQIHEVAEPAEVSNTTSTSAHGPLDCS